MKKKNLIATSSPYLPADRMAYEFIQSGCAQLQLIPDAVHVDRIPHQRHRLSVLVKLRGKALDDIVKAFGSGILHYVQTVLREEDPRIEIQFAPNAPAEVIYTKLDPEG